MTSTENCNKDKEQNMCWENILYRKIRRYRVSITKRDRSGGGESDLSAIFKMYTPHIKLFRLFFSDSCYNGLGYSEYKSPEKFDSLSLHRKVNQIGVRAIPFEYSCISSGSTYAG